MKKIVFSLLLVVGFSALAHDNPPEIGKCFIVNNGIPTKPVSCVINTGGGAGGSFINFKVKGKNILIEEGQDINVGTDAESLSKGEIYSRDYKTFKKIKNPKNDDPWYYCARQVSGKLDACFIIIDD